ncbi:hypothetical protein FQN57_000940 [Myotisia sp. PD_48]|nr:hypothetical protein FQN57_000940 [Myotisia sp. PD_48]
MASHVVVLDSSARRAVVKVTPGKHLTDVLSEACSKFRIDPFQYGLKYQKKQIDLSLTFRLAGLSSGAKLELVRLSKSPSVVSIALQLPESEAQGLPNNRLTDKFPSNTTLWLILRKFESGVAGSGVTFNLTARGAPHTEQNTSGAGRLFYQTPVLQFLGRELSSFTDLQRTLGQLGLNSGSALIRVHFRTTDRPLEEAMAEIDAYFKSEDAGSSKPESDEASSSSAIETPASSDQQVQPTPSSTEDVTMETQDEPPTPTLPTEPDPGSHPTTTVSSRPVKVYAPPTNSTPKSAQTPYDERDYLPTIDHARSHQQRLNVSSRPSRLAGDAELAAQESALQEKLAKVVEVEIKLRFPDQSQAVSTFTKEDTAKSLYDFARNCLDTHLMNETFRLTYFPNAGATAGTSGNASAAPANISQSQVHIDEKENKLLIHDLRMSGRVLVNFIWDTNAALSVRGGGGSVLRPELRRTASEIQVKDLSTVEDDDDEEGKGKSWLQKIKSGGTDSGKSGGKKGGGVPKWLKLPGKK